jgi:hypothetical protein
MIGRISISVLLGGHGVKCGSSSSLTARNTSHRAGPFVADVRFAFDTTIR